MIVINMPIAAPEFVTPAGGASAAWLLDDVRLQFGLNGGHRLFRLGFHGRRDLLGYRLDRLSGDAPCGVLPNNVRGDEGGAIGEHGSNIVFEEDDLAGQVCGLILGEFDFPMGLDGQDFAILDKADGL
jgi:hypothetical protein